MIKVTVGNNLKRNSVVIDPNMTLKAALEEAGIDYNTGVMHLDGAPLGAGELNKTFLDFGLTGEAGADKCFLLNVVKADNAA